MKKKWTKNLKTDSVYVSHPEAHNGPICLKIYQKLFDYDIYCGVF